MKKSRLVLAVVLALVLCIACICAPTFSWYTRPNAQSGNSFKWTPDYPISNGNGVSMETLVSKDGGIKYTEPVSNYSSPDGLQPGECVYYRTAITNSGTTSAQSVSLFLSGLNFKENTDDGKFYIGVNGPLRTYKGYPQSSGSDSTPTNQKVSSDKVRIYFKPNNVESWKDESTKIEIRCKDNDDVNDKNFPTTITMKPITTSNERTLYADIPISTKMCQIFANGSWEKTNGTPFMSLPGYCPNLSLTKSYLFVLQSGVDDTWQNHNCDTYEVSNGANIANYYSSIDIPQGGTFSAALTSVTDYSGKTIEYYSGNDEVFTVDKSTGQITVTEGAQVGAEAILYTKVIGEYGSSEDNSDGNDQKQVETTIKITKAPTSDTDALADVPIVTNYKISAAADDEHAAVEYVYWYIKNDSEHVLKYTISGIYLSL